MRDGFGSRVCILYTAGRALESNRFCLRSAVSCFFIHYFARKLHLITLTTRSHVHTLICLYVWCPWMENLPLWGSVTFLWAPYGSVVGWCVGPPVCHELLIGPSKHLFKFKLLVKKKNYVHHKNATKIINQNKFFKKFVSFVSFQFVGISLGEAFRAGWTSVLAKVWIINTNCITK